MQAHRGLVRLCTNCDRSSKRIRISHRRLQIRGCARCYMPIRAYAHAAGRWPALAECVVRGGRSSLRGQCCTMRPLGPGLSLSSVGTGSCGPCTGKVTQAWQTKLPQQQLLSPSETGGTLLEDRVYPWGSTRAWVEVLASTEATGTIFSDVRVAVNLAA